MNLKGNHSFDHSFDPYYVVIMYANDKAYYCGRAYMANAGWMLSALLATDEFGLITSAPPFQCRHRTLREARAHMKEHKRSRTNEQTRPQPTFEIFRCTESMHMERK